PQEDERQREKDARMSVAGAPQILPQRIARVILAKDEQRKQAYAPDDHARIGDQQDSGQNAAFSGHDQAPLNRDRIDDYSYVNRRRNRHEAAVRLITA